jgi:hypothetical protein
MAFGTFGGTRLLSSSCAMHHKIVSIAGVISTLDADGMSIDDETVRESITGF